MWDRMGGSPLPEPDTRATSTADAYDAVPTILRDLRPEAPVRDHRVLPADRRARRGPNIPVTSGRSAVERASRRDEAPGRIPT
jgi:hypothetical protein